ncbi:hypothetical protein V7S43_009840 [Phytophthora oleae]|uniref:Uncharacterized protein n=1 Tax=Phytophthora oleae TaxID=2107226 RepID=A0ABD3FH47_9STRA
MNSPTPTSAAGTSTAVLTSTAASNMATGKISVPEYFALQKEKQQAKPGSAVIDPKELFGDEIPLGYDDEELANEEGELEDKAPVPVSSSEDMHDPPLGSRRPREEAPDASSSKRPRSDDEASPMSRALISPRTDPPPVRDPWMPTDAEIQLRLGASCPPNEILLYYDNSIVDDDVADAMVFEPPTQRQQYYIGLFHELRYFSAKKTSRKSKVPEWQALCQSWNAFVVNFNKDPKGYRERIASARERYYTYTVCVRCERLHDQSMEAGIPCAVPVDTICPRCLPSAARIFERDLNQVLWHCWGYRCDQRWKYWSCRMHSRSRTSLSSWNRRRHRLVVALREADEYLRRLHRPKQDRATRYPCRVQRYQSYLREPVSVDRPLKLELRRWTL